MEQYISKTALVAEIKRRFDEYSSSFLKHYDACKEAKAQELGKILIILDTLEVKEVDINKEISQFIDANFEKAKIGHKLSLRRTAKYFFELGMSVNNKAQIGE